MRLSLPKGLLAALTLLLFFVLLGFASRPEAETSDARIDLGQSELYSEAERQAAVDLI